MGTSDYVNLSQWSNGDYNRATNQQDDLAVITGSNGFGYRVDDYSDELIGAATMAFNEATATTYYGLIETNTDVDWFQFSTTTGEINLDINVFERGANLDILAQLYDTDGAMLQASNPLGSLSASFDLSVVPGQYYLSVTGTGQGDSITGYSDYGSLGQYSISGAFA